MYENEVIRQLDLVKDIKEEVTADDVMAIEADKEIPDLSDYFKTTEEIVKQNGFAMECHTVETPDGYLLDMFRLQPKYSSQFDSNNIIG